MGEFELIRRYFGRPRSVPDTSPRAGAIRLGIGDDCALLAPRPGFELAVSTDMLVEGRHFFAAADPAALGWKSLAVNLSDLAAMAARPLAFTLALALPRADEEWLENFSRGLFECADAHGCELIGGDTTRGPLNICVAVFGEVPEGDAIRRSGAGAGDDVWVSGTLGDAALGLRVLTGSATVADVEQHRAVVRALECPSPRVALGIALRGVASAMLDVSDGLVGDLGHILESSGGAKPLGASISIDALPLSATLAAQPEAIRLECALAGGDDYELCFTAPAAMRARVLAAGADAGVRVSRIGAIDAGGRLELLDDRGQPYALPRGVELRAFDHFGQAA